MTQQTKGQRTRARLLEAAAKLLRRHGYYGTSLSDIVAASGAPRGSVYFHFPEGKEAIAAAALARSGVEWQARLEALIDAAPEPATAVQMVCEALYEALRASQFEEGCPLAAAALETASSSNVVRGVCNEHFGRWIDSIAERFVSAGMVAERAHQLALFTLSTIEGALLLSKVRRNQDALRAAGAMLSAMISAELAAG